VRTLGIVSLLLALAGTAQAATTVEPKVRVLVRERPTLSSRIVDRVAPGHKMPLLGHNPDGSWAHVETGKRDGWVPTSQLKGKAIRTRSVDPDDGEEEVVAAPRKSLAPKKGVRPEAWVSSSRYHDGENNKLTVSATKAELFGRPASGGTVVGVVRRGDVVDLVRRSSDRRWILVDIGGGEVAWIDARNVRAGAFRAPAADDAPPPPPARSQRAAVPEREVEREVEREPQPEEAAPPPAPKRSKRVERVVQREPEPEPEPPPPREEKRVSRGDDEAPPLLVEKRSKKNKRLMASRDDSGVRAAARRHDEQLVATGATKGPGNNFFGIGVRAGVAIIDQRFTSNGTGALTNYQAATDALGVQVGAGYTRAIGRYFRIGLDGSYAFAGAAAVRYHATDGSQIVLGVQNHDIEFGAQLGLHFDVIGGLDLRARLGGMVGLNLIQGSSKAPLPSDRVLGMTWGLAIAAPNLVTLAGRPFGAHLFGLGVAPASRAQTIGLEDGAQSTTIGAELGGGLHYGLYKGLSLEAAYGYTFMLTHYAGPSRRNVTVTQADRGSAQHLITLGLSYNY
jgi:uncharacterized protein YgiM (DUF1202 family)/opacity protein-like surface antigen